jgi:hypothetical protein
MKQDEHHPSSSVAMSPKYNLLIILTDGIIRDMKETIHSIIESTAYPISILVIGIGEHDFINMRLLQDHEIYYDYLQDQLDLQNHYHHNDGNDESDHAHHNHHQTHHNKKDSSPAAVSNVSPLLVYKRNNVQFLS